MLNFLFIHGNRCLMNTVSIEQQAKSYSLVFVFSVYIRNSNHICTTVPSMTKPVFSHSLRPNTKRLYLPGFLNLKYDFRGRHAHVHSFNKAGVKINGAVLSLLRKILSLNFLEFRCWVKVPQFSISRLALFRHDFQADLFWLDSTFNTKIYYNNILLEINSLLPGY